jgi:uncharacterized membrane-anchored protein
METSYMPELSLRVRNLVLALTTLAVLVIVNAQILAKENIISDGHIMLLQLAPRDPRSLLQGDYMALRYSIAQTAAADAKQSGISDGKVVVTLNEDNVAGFRRIHDGGELLENEKLLQFRMRGEAVRLASDAFFFQEGQSERYASARYGEVRVDSDGNAVLIGLRDDKLTAL